jgi:hypothetical protein
VYDWRHDLAIFLGNPTALHNGAPFAGLLDALKRLGSDREMAEMLTLVLQHDQQTVLCAVELALESEGVFKQHMLNVLGRVLEPVLPLPVETPSHLRLSDAPLANVDRYDVLLKVEVAERAVNYQMQVACFSNPSDLSGFNCP